MKVFLITLLVLSSVLLAGGGNEPNPNADIPEPATLLLLGVGGAALAAYKKFKK